MLELSGQLRGSVLGLVGCVRIPEKHECHGQVPVRSDALVVTELVSRVPVALRVVELRRPLGMVPGHREPAPRVLRDGHYSVCDERMTKSAHRRHRHGETSPRRW